MTDTNRPSDGAIAKAFYQFVDVGTTASYPGHNSTTRCIETLARELDAAQPATTDKDVALAEQWVCANCDYPQIENTILEALCAYDPSKVGARTAPQPVPVGTFPAQPDSRGGADYVMVPREPTQEMLDAAGAAQDRGDWIGAIYWRKGYAAMLAAAPSPTSQPSGEDARDADKRRMDWLMRQSLGVWQNIGTPEWDAEGKLFMPDRRARIDAAIAQQRKGEG